MKLIGLKILGVIVALAIFFVCALINGVIVMLLWNWLLPDLFGLTTITYWQGVGLSYLCSILFKSVSTSNK